MRWTTALDQQRRQDHISLLVFAGFATASAGAISLADIQKRLLDQFPELLSRFPSYENYFALSTWVAFIGGLLFALYPVTITLWIGRVLVAMSLLYLILGGCGVAALSPVAFHASYWLTLLVAIGTQLAALRFYLCNTRLDGPMLLVLAIGLIGWAIYEMATLPAIGG